MKLAWKYSIRDSLKNLFRRILYWMFDLHKMEFNSIAIRKNIIEQIIGLAKDRHPKEFMSFLDGHVKDKILLIDSLIYHEYEASENSAAPIFHFADKSFYGSVHSHPGPSSRPSNADRDFFRKTGIIHIIICYPYKENNIRFYDSSGTKISVDII